MKKSIKKGLFSVFLAATVLALGVANSEAACGISFNVVGGATETNAQFLCGSMTGTVEAGGTLNVTGANAVTILGSNNTLTNNGSIISNGNVNALDVTGTSSNVITNNGTISGGASGAVLYSGVTLYNNGTIIGNGDDTIYLAGSTVYNNGTLQSNFGVGASVANGGILYNSGTISTLLVPNMDALYLTGSGTVYNSGTIEASSGIGANIQNGTLTNSGTIQSNTNSGAEVVAGTLNNSGIIQSNYGAVWIGGGTIINNGIIQSSSGRGVEFEGGMVTNYGTIRGATYAIFDGVGANSTLNLYPGSQLFGAIDLGTGDTDIVNIYGGGTVSYTVDFVGADVINVYGAGLPVFVNGNKVTVVGLSNGASTNASKLSSTTSSVHGVLSSHVNHGAYGSGKHASRPLQVAALELAPGMLHVEEPAKAWAEVFTFKIESEGSNTALSTESEGNGVVLGYDFDLSSTRAGLMAGFAASSSDTSVKSVKTDTTSMYLGAFGRLHLGFANLTASLVGGMENHENTRYVQYLLLVEKAKADYSSYFISPSLGIGTAFKAGESFELRPSAGVSYVMAEYDGYQEKGTTAQNLKVKGYGATALTSSAQLAIASVGKGGELELRAGIRARNTETDGVGASLAGVNFKYSAAKDEKIDGTYGGVFVRYELAEKASLTADMEMANLGHGNEKEFFATLGVDISF